MTDQLFVGQLQQKVGELKTEYDLHRSIKDNTVNAKIQRSRDKICEILRRVQNQRPKTHEESEFSVDSIQQEVQPIKQSKYNEEVLQRRHYIFQFKMYLRRKRERQQREEEFKLLKLLDVQTEALQRWVSKDSNDNDMFDFFYTQIDSKNKGQVHHLQFKDFMYENPLIMSLFQFDRQSLQNALDSFPVKERFHLSQNEFMEFLYKYQKVKPEKGYREYVHLFDPLHKKVNLFENTPRILLLKDTIQLEQAFNSVSENGMATIDNAIRAIRQECPLFVNAVHVVALGLNLLLESVLQQIEIGYLANPDQEMSWNQFFYFFDNLPQDDETIQQEEEQQSIHSESSDDYFYEMTSKLPPPPPPVEEKKKVKKPSPPRKPFQEINVERMQFTVPKKLEYEKREVNKQPGIRERWVMEQVQKKQELEEEAFKYRPFKAKKVPFKSKDKNYYMELLELEDIRRRELKDRCKERTQKLQKPFSFEVRVREQPPKIEEPEYKFRANPIPWYCSLKLYERNIQEQKAKSERLKKIRKFWLQENSKLPPRMQEWLDKMKLKEEEQELQLQSERKSQKKVRAKSIPDFKKFHDQLDKQLEKLKRKKKSTVPQGPVFHESRKKPERSYLDAQPQNKEDPIKKAKKAVAKKPKFVPRSTHKFDAYVEHNYVMKQNQLYIEEQQYKEQEQRDEKKQLFLPRVQQSWAIADYNQLQVERQQQKFVEQRQRQMQEEEEFNNMMKEIFVRVYQRPLLMEVEAMKCQQTPMDEQEQQEQFDYMNPIGEQEVEESERISEQDPVGVEQVGEQAEQSFKEYDGQEIDGEYQIDIDNIDPQMLNQLQRDALAKQYGLTQEQLDQLEQGLEDEEYEEEEDEPNFNKRHSF